MVLRLLLGLVKGGVLGAAVGYGAYAADLAGGFHWVTYGVIGALVGLVVGRPVWSHLRDRSGTIWTPILKSMVGFGVAVGIYALVAKVWGGVELPLFAGETRLLQDWQFLFGGAVGALYGAFVELDDAPAPVAKQDKAREANH
jgi:hypothetical protein